MIYTRFRIAEIDGTCRFEGVINNRPVNSVPSVIGDTVRDYIVIAQHGRGVSLSSWGDCVAAVRILYERSALTSISTGSRGASPSVTAQVSELNALHSLFYYHPCLLNHRSHVQKTEN